MAEVQQNSSTSSSEIKLFGATITPEQGSQQSSDDAHREEEPRRPDDHDPTAERRPEKIIPCPRCKSTETKFCYFNNYNVNQPRHFCKGCQRYWTAGGALRNVPVGAGRRKAKPPCRGMLEEWSAAGDGQLDFDVAGEWEDGRRQFPPGKRRRCGDSQSC